MIPLGLKYAGGNGHDTFAIDTATTTGGTISANSGTNDVAGSWVELIASASFDATLLAISFLTSSISGDGEFINFQLGIGASGSEVAMMDWYKVSPAQDSFPEHLTIPLNIQAGDRIAIRTIGNAWDNFIIHGGALINVPATLSHNMDLSYNAAYDTGVLIDTGGVANTKSAWVEVVSSIMLDVKWLDIHTGIQTGRGASSAAYLYDIALGASGSEVVLLANRKVAAPAYNDASFPRISRVPVNIPAGSRIAVRAQSDYITATFRNLHLAINGWGD